MESSNRTVRFKNPELGPIRSGFGASMKRFLKTMNLVLCLHIGDDEKSIFLTSQITKHTETTAEIVALLEATAWLKYIKRVQRINMPKTYYINVVTILGKIC